MPKQFQAVSCVIVNQDKILMLKRSSRVRTNKGLWSVVAGEVVGDPLSTALTEIEEETGLSKSDVIFIKRGEPLMVSLSKNTLTTIHPFLFRTDKMNVKIDWEHEEYRWLTLGEIVGLSLVPRFLDMLKSLGLKVTY